MRTPVRLVVVAIAAIVAAHLGDHWAWMHLVKPGIYDHDFGRMLRTVGYLPIWLVLALGLWLQTGDRRRALLLGLVPTAGGGLCAVLQVVIRRERPGLHQGHYFFRPFTDRLLHGAEFGLPSSHAMVAFSAAWLLCRIYPRAWPVWLALAAACALSRVAAQAHFLSDVTVGAVAAYFLVAVVWNRFPPHVPSSWHARERRISGHLD
ncbi:MAG: phosphatase PAP2 family protein [Gemmatimonadales bacterium]